MPSTPSWPAARETRSACAPANGRRMDGRGSWSSSRTTAPASRPRSCRASSSPSSRRRGEGRGLGLSVSYGIVQQHGGRLTAESVPGRTVFTLELPSVSQTESARQTASPGNAGVFGFGRRALVVDDEPGMVDLLTALLKDTGWQVEVASTGRSALERVRATRFDIVLSDIRMPDGNGEDFYRAVVREQPALAKRFVFMTGDTANPSAWQFLEAENVPALEKPFTAESLFRILEQLTILTSRGAFE